MKPFSVIIPGQPATKKNSAVVVRNTLPVQMTCRYWLRDRAHWPDLVGLMQATADIISDERRKIGGKMVTTMTRRGETMRIGLVDVDGTTFPNLVLMKISAWHKRQGDTTCLLRPDDVLLGSNLFGDYDKIYAACVFTANAGIARRLEAIGAEVGGTGTDRAHILPPEIEHLYPDYAIYGNTRTAYGFLTRGCPRACPFCIVAGKEGRESRKVADLSEFWSGEKTIKLLDPNILAAREHKDLLRQLAESGAWVDFTQGLDARMLTADNIDLLNACKVKMLHFAWDNPRDEIVPKMLRMFVERSAVTDYRKRRVYVLTNYWSTHEEDLRRVYWLRENGYDPYVMIYDKPHAPRETRQLQRWVNNKLIFRSCERFEDYRG